MEPGAARVRGQARGMEWSSAKEYAGVSPGEQLEACELTIDRVQLPAELSARYEASVTRRGEKAADFEKHKVCATLAGVAKFAFDFSTFAYGYLFACQQ